MPVFRGEEGLGDCTASFDKSQDARGLIPLGLLRKELFSDLLESVIPDCFYRESRRDRDWTPD